MEPALAHLRLSSSVKEIPGVGPRRVAALRRLGIATINDLLRHQPLRYEQHCGETDISGLTAETIGSVRGTVVATRWAGPPGNRGGGRFIATLQDHAATLNLVWFNARYLVDQLRPGTVIRVQGKVTYFNGYPQIVNPQWHVATDEDAVQEQDELHPIYPATEELPTRIISRLVQQVLPAVISQVADPLPADFLQQRALPDLQRAIAMSHQPESMEQAQAARRRLAYNELLLLQLGIVLRRHALRTHHRAPALRWSPAIDEHIRQRFPFPLTQAQQAAVAEIAADLQQTKPMNRLLQGDVGAGKTVVALYALLMAVAERRQGAIMTPTELLAEQHFASISRMLEGSNVRLALLSSSTASRASLEAKIENGEIDLVVGTQALLTESVRFQDLAVVVIDEQHRFGVEQRAMIRSRASEAAVEPGQPTPSPHYLVMTATPIPRTLSLTVFGDLDVSTIRGLPPGRQPIVTRVVPPEKADEVYPYVFKRIAQGEQAYVVVPAIDDSGDDSAELKSVRSHAQLLQDKYAGELSVATMHGRMKRQTRDAIMERFRTGHIHVLVATTVIEVGVDVPNATMMVVEHAERFGLAQLHQLRGRVGRGTHGRKSICVFIAQPDTPDAQQRMNAIGSTSDGFRIAELDLEIRGMGDFFGTRQHGLPPLRVARIPEDMELLQLARRDAEQIVADDPEMTDAGHSRLKALLLQQHGQALGLIDVG